MLLFVLKKSVIFVFFYLFFLEATCENIDSLKLSLTNKRKKYVIVNPGYVYFSNELNKQVGYILPLHVDFEYFAFDKLSFIYRVGGQYLYLKHEAEAIDLETAICSRKYFKIKKSSKVFVYTSLGFLHRSLKDLSPYTKFNHSIGFNSSTGIGMQIFPLRKRKNKISRFGMDFSFGFLHFYSGAPSRYNTLGIKYRICN